GDITGAGNVISGNDQRGIYLMGAGASQYLIQGNYIGTNSGGQDLGNGGAGILVSSSTSNNQIGGTQTGAGNTIAFNSSDGIWISNDAGSNNAILGNSIYSNSGIGIDLLNDNVTANDLGDGDTGPNNLQNYPLLEKATIADGNTTITGTLNSVAGTTFRVEFFSSPVSDPSGNGEGETFLDFIVLTTDGSGNASFDTTFIGMAVTEGHVISSTATVDLGSSNYGNTSEFAANVIASTAIIEYDMPCTAAELAVNQSCSFQVFNNSDATDSGIPLSECNGYAGGDIWFKLKVPASGNAIVKIESDAVSQSPAFEGWAHRLGLAVYSGSCSTPSYDTCWIEPEGPGPPNNPEMLLTGLTPGDTLLLRVWEYANDFNGKFRICVFTDDEDPTISCPDDINAQTDLSSCTASIIVPIPVVSDNYGIESVINDYNGTANATDNYPLGTTIVTWTVTDLSGNTALCSQNIIVSDTIDPIITCPADITENTDDNCQFVIPDYTLLVTINDNCDSNPAVTQSPVAGTILSGSGTTQEIILLASDASGNEAECRFNILLQDNALPFVVSLSDTLVMVQEGIYETFITMPAPDFGDNCGIQSLVNDFNGGSDASGTYQFGNTTVSYTVTDINGNSIQVNQQVEVRLENESEYGLIIPEGFSPNEDGLNDRFEILGIYEYPDNELHVYNVYGNEVYNKHGYDNTWDGTSSNNLNDGRKLPSGTYYYIITLNRNGTILKGSVYIRNE
ncbi:MAG: gliding motility-associated C-terminal domain-containing protein, partial [Bacteroidales bacterium]|nr:gliding motility-associated C-terminal domain-containing protein [Bacteroidales bacterium]